MSSAPTLSSAPDARAALHGLCAGLLDDPAALRSAELLLPGQVPEPYRRLLVHRDHMTTTLAAYHGAPPRLRVLQQELSEDVYSRRIVLECSRSAGHSHGQAADGLPMAPGGTMRVVELGLVRIHFALVPRPVRDEITARQKPLGDILIRHNVLRSVEPRWFWRFSSSGPLLNSFGNPDLKEVFGRVGVIMVDGAAAIELLEVVNG